MPPQDLGGFCEACRLAVPIINRVEGRARLKPSPDIQVSRPGQRQKGIYVSILKVANLALSFFLELCMVLAYGYWGFTTGSGLIMQLLLGIGVPLIVIVIWGIFLAPASKQRLQGVPHWTLEIILFVASIVALFVAGQPSWAIIFAVLYSINVTLRLVWKQ